MKFPLFWSEQGAKMSKKESPNNPLTYLLINNQSVVRFIVSERERESINPFLFAPYPFQNTLKEPLLGSSSNRETHLKREREPKQVLTTDSRPKWWVSHTQYTHQNWSLIRWVVLLFIWLKEPTRSIDLINQYLWPPKNQDIYLNKSSHFKGGIFIVFDCQALYRFTKANTAPLKWYTIELWDVQGVLRLTLRLKRERTRIRYHLVLGLSHSAANHNNPLPATVAMRQTNVWDTHSSLNYQHTEIEDIINDQFVLVCVIIITTTTQHNTPTPTVSLAYSLTAHTHTHTRHHHHAHIPHTYTPS